MQDIRPTILGADLEGVFLPEIWIAVAEKTGIEELRLTTRDISDYDQLMNHRIQILEEHNLKITDIQTVIATLDPLPGAVLTGYQLRLVDGKRKCIAAFRDLGFRTMAMGDSYNDTAMLSEADLGILFCPPNNVIEEFPQFPVTTQYQELKVIIEEFLEAPNN